MHFDWTRHLSVNFDWTIRIGAGFPRDVKPYLLAVTSHEKDVSDSNVCEPICCYPGQDYHRVLADTAASFGKNLENLQSGGSNSFHRGLCISACSRDKSILSMYKTNRSARAVLLTIH